MGTSASVGFSGGGALSAEVIQKFGTTTTLTGSGALDLASMLIKVTMATAFSGGGTMLSPLVSPRLNILAALAGSGAMTAVLVAAYLRTAPFTGNGSLTATAAGTLVVSVVGTPVATDDATSIPLPAHNVGDTILIAAVRLSTAVTKPAAGGTVPNWIDIDSGAGGGTTNIRTVYCIATATNHTSGVWSGNTGLFAIVLRGANASNPIGGHGINGAVGGALTAPAVTMSRTDDTSMLLHFYGQGGSGLVWPAAPTGYTRQASATGSTNVAHICANSKDLTTSDGAIAQGTNVGSWVAATVEVHI